MGEFDGAELVSRTYKGLQTVETDNIVGSVGRCADFHKSFRFKLRTSQRYKRIRKAMAEGEIAPPVMLYKVDGEYYILDGHHRVVAARELGQKFLDAEVIEFVFKDVKPPGYSSCARKEFEDATGLVDAVVLESAAAYRFVLDEIEKYRSAMARTRGRATDLQEAAQRWFKEVVSPHHEDPGDQ